MTEVLDKIKVRTNKHELGVTNPSRPCSRPASDHADPTNC
jgi:hypothetical protein